MSSRSRWAAIGAAVAVTLGAGGVSLGQAAIGSGAKPVFVAITPCRLVDTRPGDANIGGRTSPLSANDTLTLQITGSTGECAGIPAGATAAAMNVTAIQGSTRSFLTVYPADASLPNASNLNWNGGDPPTPNKVDVALSPSGAVKLTNDAGTVHVAADLVGYYTDHTHDDRYYTKSQSDQQRAISKFITFDTSLNGTSWKGIALPPPFTEVTRFHFVVPPDYTAGTDMTLVVTLYAENVAAGCTINLGPNGLNGVRAGFGLLGGWPHGMSDPAPVVMPTGSFYNAAEVTFTLTRPELTDLQPGDSVEFGFYAEASTCAANDYVHGVILYYD